MKDPEADDTEPTGCAFASAEDTDLQGHVAAAPMGAPSEELDAESGEYDTENLLRWLPTMSLGHRRRTELVERPSSDGADFAAYAYAGRPASASAAPRPEAAVQVQPPAARHAPEPDAPTVLSRRRLAGRRRRLFAWAAGGLVAACTVVAGWTHRPEQASSYGAARAQAPVSDRAPRAPPVESVRPPSQAASGEGSQAATTHLPEVPVVPRAAPSGPPARQTAHKREAANAHMGVDMPAKSHAPPVAAASAAAAKDQYFETQ